MHQRFPRASVDLGFTPDPCDPRAQEVRFSRQPTQTLWAVQPLAIKGGRLVAARLRDGQVEVRYVSGQDGVGRWTPAHRLISPHQEQVWVATSEFRP